MLSLAMCMKYYNFYWEGVVVWFQSYSSLCCWVVICCALQSNGWIYDPVSMQKLFPSREKSPSQKSIKHNRFSQQKCYKSFFPIFCYVNLDDKYGTTKKRWTIFRRNFFGSNHILTRLLENLSFTLSVKLKHAWTSFYISRTSRTTLHWQDPTDRNNDTVYAEL